MPVNSMNSHFMLPLALKLQCGNKVPLDEATFYASSGAKIAVPGSRDAESLALLVIILP